MRIQTVRAGLIKAVHSMTAHTRNERLLSDAKRTIRSFCPQSVLNWRETQYFGKYGEVELHIVEYLCRPEQDAIDVGAHDGCYIHFMKRHSRRVYAFEPIPWMAKDLARKFGAGVIVSTIALSRSAGSAILKMPVVDGVVVPGCSSISLEASASYEKTLEIPVQMDALDRIYAGDAGFLKIDVEGHEEALLDGARMTLARSRPRVLVEVVERLAPGGVRRVTDFFRNLDYRGYFIYQRKLLPIEQFAAHTLQRAEDEPDLTADLTVRHRFGRYICNFLFFPLDEPRETFLKIEQRLARL